MELQRGRALDSAAERGHNHMSFLAAVAAMK